MDQERYSLHEVRVLLKELRARIPLVHNITNYVVMQVTANALLAIGASPVMAHEEDEMDDITGSASALVLNIGTISRGWLRSMRKALDVATRRGIPVVIDPVGAGASGLRTQAALELLAASERPLLRGNASEILALAGQGRRTRGVDSTDEAAAAHHAAKEVAQRFQCAVCVSGEVDGITDGRTLCLVRGGSPLMPKITGMGCSASALAGAFAGVCGSNRVLPLVAAMSVMAAAGKEAAQSAQGPGSFVPLFMDSLYSMGADMLFRGAALQWA